MVFEFLYLKILGGLGLIFCFARNNPVAVLPAIGWNCGNKQFMLLIKNDVVVIGIYVLYTVVFVGAGYISYRVLVVVFYRTFRDLKKQWAKLNEPISPTNLSEGDLAAIAKTLRAGNNNKSPGLLSGNTVYNS